MAKISIKDLCIQFQIYGQSSRSIKKLFLKQATGGIIDHKNDSITVKAVDSLSLEINEGDRIGFTGYNGAGKSTLLRALAGIYKPTSGSITIEGTVGTLIDMTAGMDPEATGIENIYLRSYILGFCKKDVPKLVEEIRKFTELGNFLELPIKTYSAGMISRLNFAISTSSMAPDILIMDENISAGDRKFQEQARDRLKDFKKKVKILIMAHHDENVLNFYCNKVIRLQSGKIEYIKNVSTTSQKKKDNSLQDDNFKTKHLGIKRKQDQTQKTLPDALVVYRTLRGR